MDLEVVEELVGGLFWPFHQVEVVVNIWSVIMGQSLGVVGVQVVDRSLGLDDKALFWFQQRLALVVGICKGSNISPGTMGIGNGLASWFHV